MEAWAAARLAMAASRRSRLVAEGSASASTIEEWQRRGKSDQIVTNATLLLRN